MDWRDNLFGLFKKFVFEEGKFKIFNFILFLIVFPIIITGIAADAFFFS
jgi:hypothetical protein